MLNLIALPFTLCLWFLFISRVPPKSMRILEILAQDSTGSFKHLKLQKLDFNTSPRLGSAKKEQPLQEVRFFMTYKVTSLRVQSSLGIV